MATLETTMSAPVMLAATEKIATRMRLANRGRYLPVGMNEIPRASGPAVMATKKIIPTTSAKLSMGKP